MTDFVLTLPGGSLLATVMICYVTFTMEGQSKAAEAFTGNFDVYGPTLFKLCMHVAYWPMLMICYVAFTIKGRSNLDRLSISMSE